MTIPEADASFFYAALHQLDARVTAILGTHQDPGPGDVDRAIRTALVGLWTPLPDADAYQGHSYTRVYVEELGTFPSASPVLRLMATLRSGEGVPCGFRATGNPGGPGHQWVKARYIDPNPAGWEVRKFTFENPWTRDTIEQDRVFIPSKLQDNKFLGPEYVANLQMVGSDTLVRAWLEGDWTVIEGAYFDCWRYEQHVVEPFEVPAHWARFRSMDWGSAKPFSVG